MPTRAKNKYKGLRETLRWLTLPNSVLDSLFVTTAARTAEWSKYESLGDAVLRALVVQLLFHKFRVKGELHDAVEIRVQNTSPYMIDTAKALGFEALLRLHETTVTDKMLVDTLEAFVGMCADHGIFTNKKAKPFVAKYFTGDALTLDADSGLGPAAAVAGAGTGAAAPVATKPAAGGAGAGMPVRVSPVAAVKSAAVLPASKAAAGLFGGGGGAGAPVIPSHSKAEMAIAAKPAITFLSKVA